MAEQSSPIIRVPLNALDSYDAVVAEDVLSPEGALLLPQGLRLSLLGPSLPKTMDRLRASGVEAVYLRTDPSVSLDSIDSFLEGVLSQNQGILDRRVSQEAVTQVRGLFDSVRRQPVTPELLVPLVSTGQTLAQQILRSPQVLLSLARVHQWDEYTFIHSFNVAALAGFLTYRLHSDDPELVEKVVVGGLLHDLGKAQVPPGDPQQTWPPGGGGVRPHETPLHLGGGAGPSRRRDGSPDSGGDSRTPRTLVRQRVPRRPATGGDPRGGPHHRRGGRVRRPHRRAGPTSAPSPPGTP